MSEQSTAARAHEQSPIEHRGIADFPRYRIGSDGAVWSWFESRDSRGRGEPPHWRKLKQTPKRDKTGRVRHVFVRLCREGQQFDRLVHRLVLEAFVGPCPPGMECCHNDGNAANNQLGNLRWDTHENNAADRRQHGTHLEGSAIATAILTEGDIPKVLRLLEAGVAMHRIAYGFGVGVTQINAIAHGRAWKQLQDTSANGMREKGVVKR